MDDDDGDIVRVSKEQGEVFILPDFISYQSQKEAF